jgi:2-succinyl-5-enolpyruvyl-6-hydroxy-3-cyclohexene-1-carboxylate synthase
VKNDPNLNALWCRALAEELQRCGVHRVVLCPGSRNSPLLFALQAHFPDKWVSHIDERSAGFLALGMIKASGLPCAVCVTSGSAVAQLMPALVEADAAELPLIIISADRPWEMQHCGAPQTMEQRNIFAPFVRASLMLGEPIASDAALRALRSQTCRALTERSGPIHMNVPLRDPLPPLPDKSPNNKWIKPTLASDADMGRDNVPFTHFSRGAHTAKQQLPPWVRSGLRGIIVIGNGEYAHHQSSIAELARLTGFPVLADVASTYRQPAMPQIITLGDVLVQGLFTSERAELIIQIGQIPIARAVQDWLQLNDCPWISLSNARHVDALARAWWHVSLSDHAQIIALGNALKSGDSAWQARWLTAENHGRAALQQFAHPWGEHRAVASALNYPGFSFVHLASSMAIRYANVQAPAHPRRVFANRGVNGIDGTIATFLGLAALSAAPGLVIIGDVALLHDLSALKLRDPHVRGAVVLLNNGGGGIFDFLPVHNVPYYETLVRTNHTHDFARTATAWDMAYHRVSDDAGLLSALNASVTGSGLHLIECVLSADNAVEQHRQLMAHLIRNAR